MSPNTPKAVSEACDCLPVIDRIRIAGDELLLNDLWTIDFFWQVDVSDGYRSIVSHEDLVSLA